MNMMTPIVAEQEPAWTRYLPAVDALRPTSKGRDRRQRAGLMLLRDTAARARRATVSPEAEQAFSTIEVIAGEHALGDMPEANLFALRRGLANMWSAALEIAAATQRDG